MRVPLVSNTDSNVTVSNNLPLFIKNKKIGCHLGIKIKNLRETCFQNTISNSFNFGFCQMKLKDSINFQDFLVSLIY